MKRDCYREYLYYDKKIGNDKVYERFLASLIFVLRKLQMKYKEFVHVDEVMCYN